MTDKHWTNDHIVFEKETGYYVGYDETGLQHCYSRDRNEVVVELERYAQTLNVQEDN